MAGERPGLKQQLFMDDCEQQSCEPNQRPKMGQLQSLGWGTGPCPRGTLARPAGALGCSSSVKVAVPRGAEASQVLVQNPLFWTGAVLWVSLGRPGAAPGDRGQQAPGFWLPSHSLVEKGIWLY